MRREVRVGDVDYVVEYKRGRWRILEGDIQPKDPYVFVGRVFGLPDAECDCTDPVVWGRTEEDLLSCAQTQILGRLSLTKHG